MMPNDSLIEKLARRCEEASDALLAEQHENPGGDEVDFLADALMSARAALYLARAEQSATVAHAYVSRIAATVRAVASPTSRSTSTSTSTSSSLSSPGAAECAVVRLAIGLLMQRHQLSKFASAAMLEGVCERYGVSVAAVARQIVRDDGQWQESLRMGLTTQGVTSVARKA